MVNPCSLFVDGEGMTENEIQVLLALAQKAQWDVIAVMDNMDLCLRLKRFCPVVIHRDSNFEPKVDDPNFTLRVQTFLNNLPAAAKAAGIKVMLDVEMGFSAQFCKLWANCINNSNGWGLVVGNPASGSVKSGQGADPNQWDTDALPLLQALNDHPESYLGIHEYTYPIWWAASNGSHGDPAYEPDSIDWNNNQYHIGRNIQGILKAIKNHNLTNLQKRKFAIITEGLFDNMADLNSYYGFKCDGWRQLIGWWAQKFPGIDPEFVLANNHIGAMNKVYIPSGIVLGLLAFMYRDQWNNWGNYRVDNAPKFLDAITSYRPSGTVTVPVIPPPPVVPPATNPPPTQPGAFFTTDQLNVLTSAAQQILSAIASAKKV